MGQQNPSGGAGASAAPPPSPAPVVPPTTAGAPSTPTLSQPGVGNTSTVLVLPNEPIQIAWPESHWYESQFIGVLAGAFLGAFLGYVGSELSAMRIWRRGRLDRKNALLGAFAGELAAARKVLRSRLVETIAATTHPSASLKEYTTGVSRAVFLASAGSLGELGDVQLASELAQFYSTVDEIDRAGRLMVNDRDPGRNYYPDRAMLPAYSRRLAMVLHLSIAVDARLRWLTQELVDTGKWSMAETEDDQTDLALIEQAKRFASNAPSEHEGREERP